MRHHLVPRVTTKLLMPFILLFALYVQFHGDFGPGGGFQAGVILGSANARDAVFMWRRTATNTKATGRTAKGTDVVFLCL